MLVRVVFLGTVGWEEREGGGGKELVALRTYVDENSAALVDRMSQDSGDRFD